MNSYFLEVLWLWRNQCGKLWLFSTVYRVVFPKALYGFCTLQLLCDFLHYGVLQTVPIRTKVAGVWCHRFNQGLWYEELVLAKKICCITINKYTSEWLFRNSVPRNCPCCHGVWIAFRVTLFLWIFCATQNTNSKACLLPDVHLSSSWKRPTFPLAQSARELVSFPLYPILPSCGNMALLQSLTI